LGVQMSAAKLEIKMLMPNIDIHSVEKLLSSENRYPDSCFPMIGLHPTSVREDYLDQLDILEKLWSGQRFIAIGEIGIDLYWDKAYIKEQLYSLRRQISFAIENNVPVAVHSRDSFPEVLSVLEEFEGGNLKGVLHAFTGSLEDARRVIGMGFMLGIGGIVTFKNSGLDKIVKEIGPDHIILETDSPYLAPVPHRGKRNESAYIRLINKKLSEIFSTDEEEIASITYNNAMRLFNL